jgi:hypothetical protein
MSNVLVEGWQDQRNPKPVSLVDVMRRHAGLSLPAAKKLLDSFAEEGQVVVEFQTAEQAKAFVKDAQAIGAIVRVVQREG